MARFADFLETLFTSGEVAMRDPPGKWLAEDRQAAEVLQTWYKRFQLSVAGPPLPLSLELARAAAELLYHASWFLVDRRAPADTMRQMIRMPDCQPTAADHLSADLLLRYLPQIHQRARALDPGEPLTEQLAHILRLWPLSGVLSSVEEAPTAAVDFDGHPGLLMLYAERWMKYQKVDWLPTDTSWEYLQWVWQDQGRSMDTLLAKSKGKASKTVEATRR